MTLTADQKPSLWGWRRYVSDLWGRKDFAVFLIQGNLTARNSSTALGLMWWILNPLLSAAVYYVVFGLILEGHRAQDFFLTYLVVGVFAFQYTTASMNGGANLIQQNSRLLVNVRFPRLILPIAAVAESLAGFLTSLVAVFAVVLIQGAPISAKILWLPVVIVIQTIFVLGLSALTARWVVPIRDLGNLIPHITRFWFYLTPIIWGLSFLEGKPQWVVTLIELNPMYAIVQLYRVAFMDFPFVMQDLVTAVTWAFAICILGIASFTRSEGTMVRHL
jgi:teichoic acid transport system permease protein